MLLGELYNSTNDNYAIDLLCALHIYEKVTYSMVIWERLMCLKWIYIVKKNFENEQRAKKSYIYGYDYTSWISEGCNNWNCHKKHL